MKEKQPVRLDPQSITPPREGAKPFLGFVIQGVMMGPHPELTDSQRKDIQEQIKSIQQHRN